MRVDGLGLRRNLAVVLLCTILAAQIWQGTQASETLGPALQWKRPKELTPEFLASNDKPILMLIDKSWCGACTNLRTELSDREKALDLQQLSSHFVMVTASDAEEPKDSMYAPDGDYIPRILFMSPDGEVLPDLKCRLKMHPEYKYFYSTAAQVVHSMKHVLQAIGATYEHGGTLVAAPTLDTEGAEESGVRADQQPLVDLA